MFNWFSRSDLEKDIWSPNGRIRCRFVLKSGKISYAVYKNDKLVIKPSRLGFLICGEEPLRDNFKLVRFAMRSRHSRNLVKLRLKTN